MVNKFLALPIITTGPGSDGNVSLSFAALQNSRPLLTMCFVCWDQRWACKLYFKVSKSQICTFLGSFRYHKSENFLVVPIREIANPQFLMVYPQIAQLQIYLVFPSAT
jgi:hypothetical protein